MYRPTNESIAGTVRSGFVVTSYAALVSLFGQPSPENADQYKTSTEWHLKSEAGDIVTIYDWKATELYDPNGYMVEVLRGLPSFSWSIGAHSHRAYEDLLAYLKEKRAVL